MRKFFVGGNWKCNNTLNGSRDLVKNVYNKLAFNPNTTGKHKSSRTDFSLFDFFVFWGVSLPLWDDFTKEKPTRALIGL